MKESNSLYQYQEKQLCLHRQCLYEIYAALDYFKLGDNIKEDRSNIRLINLDLYKLFSQFYRF